VHSGMSDKKQQIFDSNLIQITSCISCYLLSDVGNAEASFALHESRVKCRLNFFFTNFVLYSNFPGYFVGKCEF